ncbi:MAG: hypothetical protein HZC45_04920 [Deltaproteobacteria bacterium]|nr:hypothetical protein [Deltaproteobacteria bacterium]
MKKIVFLFILIFSILSGCAPTTQRVKVDDALVKAEAQRQMEADLFLSNK